MLQSTQFLKVLSDGTMLQITKCHMTILVKNFMLRLLKSGKKIETLRSACHNFQYKNFRLFKRNKYGSVKS